MLGNEAIASFHLVVGSQVDGKSHHEMDDRKDASSGFDLVSAYITRIWGHGQAYYTLLFWDAVNSWRRHLTTSTAYFREAAALRRLYLDPAAPRKICLPEATRQGLLCVLDTLPALDDMGTVSPDGAAADIVEQCADGGGGDESVGATAAGTPKVRRVVPTGLDERFWHGKPKAGKHSPKDSGGRQQQREAASSTIAAAIASVPSSVGLRPTSFDEAQWHALAHLCRVVGSGFGMSNLGRRANDLRSKDLKRKRKAAYESVRLEVCEMNRCYLFGSSPLIDCPHTDYGSPEAIAPFFTRTKMKVCTKPCLNLRSYLTRVFFLRIPAHGSATSPC